jgi:flavin-dependent dehydrogenase
MGAFSSVFRCKYPTAYQIERTMFDKFLLDHAAERGCHVFQGAHVTDAAFDADRVTIRLERNRPSAPRTRDDRIRQPVFLGLREDKKASEVMHEKAT